MTHIIQPKIKVITDFAQLPTTQLKGVQVIDLKDAERYLEHYGISNGYYMEKRSHKASGCMLWVAG